MGEKTLVSLRLDVDLLARAKQVAEWDKTTLTALVTQTLLAHVETREYYREHLPHARRFHKDKIRPRKAPTHSQKSAVRERCQNRCQGCGITQDEWRRRPGMTYDENGKIDRHCRSYASLQVAHIIAQANYECPEDANDDANLTLLCPTCHARRDTNRRTMISYENRIPARDKT